MTELFEGVLIFYFIKKLDSGGINLKGKVGGGRKGIGREKGGGEWRQG